MPPLPASLRTGQPEIDHAHARLFELETQLAEICAIARHDEPCVACPSAWQDACDFRLSGLLTDFIGLAAVHFRAEERHMGCLPLDRALAHKYDHAEISGAFAALIAGNRDKAMVARPSEVGRILRDWLNVHIVEHDLPLAKRMGAAGGPSS